MKQFRQRRARVAGRLAVALAAALGVYGAVAPRTAVAAPAGYQLLFADEFNGTTLDTWRWIDAYPWGRTHNHQAYMAPENVIVGGGNLTLRAERRAQGGKPFTSGVISSGYSKFRVNGGYLEARILLPNTPGSWPAFWGLDDGWPPEADIMEFPLTTDGVNGYPPTDYHTAFHYTNSSGGNSAGAGRVNPSSAGDLRGSYHTFGMEWVEDTSVAFFFDGAQVSSFTNAAAVAQMTSMYLILNHAVGGWPGTPSLAQWPSGHVDETKVDWVRVWQKPPGGTSATSNWNVNGSGAWETGGNWVGTVPKYGNQTAYFGRVGDAATAAVTSNNWRTVGGITFDGAAGGATTAYTLGSTSGALQLAHTGGTALIEALANSTANQTLASRVELWSNMQVRNNMDAASIVFNGEISGNGQLLIDGPGTVVLATLNKYSGGTIIDSGAQGPGVLRASGIGALGTGTVIIGQAGNATSARLEIFGGGRMLPNNIDFRGRNANSPSHVGIQNVLGNNTLIGTISANVGGNIYQIQSDNGTLYLTGSAASATAAGVALQSIASGERAFTLQGAGNGIVNGIIRDGAGTVSIIKTGGGTWTLSGANTYSGPTTANQGKLVLASSLTTSAALNASGAGTIEVASGGARVIKTPTVSITDSAQIDLKDNKLITSSPPGTASGGTYSGLQGHVQRAYHFTAWDQPGLTTSMPDAKLGLTTIAIATGAQIRGLAATDTDTWAGQIITGASTLAMYTYAGDGNLDGAIDAGDYGIIDNFVQIFGASGYANGDFNYDGFIDAGDYGIIDNNVQAQGAPFSTSGAAANVSSVALVPEPAAAAIMIAAGAAALTTRRRRTHRHTLPPFGVA